MDQVTRLLEVGVAGVSLGELGERRTRLYARLAEVGEFRRGGVSENYRRCGRPNCACAWLGTWVMGRVSCGSVRWPVGAAGVGGWTGLRWTGCVPSWPAIAGSPS